MSSYEYHKVGHRAIRVPSVQKGEFGEEKMIAENNPKVQKFTRKEINIVFGCLYDLSSLNEYTTGYLSSDYVYDVIDSDSQVAIYYEGTSNWKLPISVGRLQKDILTVSLDKTL